MASKKKTTTRVEPKAKFLVLNLSNNSFFTNDEPFDSPRFFKTINAALEAIKNENGSFDPDYDKYKILEVLAGYDVIPETRLVAQKV